MIALLSTLAMAAPLTVGDATRDVRDAMADVEAPAVPVGPAPIINGTPYDTEDWPETGAMLVKLKLYGSWDYVTPICSSTLIAPDVVLLAAHCIDDTTLLASLPRGTDIIEFAFDQKANLSSYNRNARYNEGVVVAADAVGHEDFSIFRLKLGVAKNSDIALLFLEEPMLDVPFAYLPTAEEAEQIASGNLVEIVGWGQRSQQDPYSSGIKYGGVSVIGELGEHELQVGAQASDVRKCHGDSGGPTFMEFETDSAAKYRVIGVTSHSYDATDCASKGGVDTRVDAYLEWIDEQMTAACDDGTRSWCDWPGIIPPPDADGYHAWEENPNAGVDPFGVGPDGFADGTGSESASSEGSGGCSTVSGAGVAGMLVGLVGLLGRRR